MTSRVGKINDYYFAADLEFDGTDKYIVGDDTLEFGSLFGTSLIYDPAETDRWRNRRRIQVEITTIHELDIIDTDREVTSIAAGLSSIQQTKYQNLDSRLITSSHRHQTSGYWNTGRLTFIQRWITRGNFSIYRAIWPDTVDAKCSVMIRRVN